VYLDRQSQKPRDKITFFGRYYQEPPNICNGTNHQEPPPYVLKKKSSEEERGIR
jgi:hypothetical protein